MREKVSFPSAGVACAAWHYPGTNGGCVVMTGGFGVTKEPGTDRFAEQFAAAGFSVLAFDHRHFGESEGQPRQVARVTDQLADWRAAIAYAKTLPEVERVAIWAFSLAGGYVVQLAAEDLGLAAAIAQSANVDGPVVARNASRYQTPWSALRLFGRALLDTVGGLFGRPPRLVDLAGPPGTVALLNTPDAQLSDATLNPDNRYPDWQQAIAARSVLPAVFYRPTKYAADARCPILYVVCADDQSALAAPTLKAAATTPKATVLQVPGNHYAPFLAAHAQVVEAELSFLQKHLAAAPAPTHPPYLPPGPSPQAGFHRNGRPAVGRSGEVSSAGCSELFDQRGASLLDRGDCRVGVLVGTGPVAHRVPGVPVAGRGPSYMSRGQTTGGQVRAGELEHRFDGHDLSLEVEGRDQLDGVRPHEAVPRGSSRGEPAEGLLGNLAELGGQLGIQGLHTAQSRIRRTQRALAAPHQHLLGQRLPPPDDPRQPHDVEVQLVGRPLPPRHELLAGAGPARRPRTDMPSSERRHTGTLAKRP
ncbi:alpha/beta hydrolase [Kribbella sp. NPDC054772]